MNPLRRKQTCHVTEDSATGRDRVLGFTQEDDILSDLGSIDSVTIQRLFFLDCGCNKPAFGRCYECGAISCEEHHGICRYCQKPLCTEHSFYLKTEETKEDVRLCGKCFGKASRKQTRSKIGRVILSLFLERGRNDG